MTVKILQGDCRDVLATLPADSVHCVVTSPPYWGLRDYGTAKWEGGDPECDHKQAIGASKGSTLNGSLAHKDGRIFTPYRSECGKCGARRVDSQIGLENTFEQFIAEMVKVIRRVLRPDGTLWLNLGDSYAVQGGKKRDTEESAKNAVRAQERGYDVGGWSGRTEHIQRCTNTAVGGLKPKDLCGIPWRVALALQADGWWLRQDIIWSKPNPMPESVTDRCTKAHEYLFLLSKSARYYWDAEAIKEEQTDPRARTNGKYDDEGLGNRSGASRIVEGGRNKRSVWEIATHAYPEAHFATFPPALVEPCIKAGTSEKGCCGKCGAPWERTTSVSYTDAGNGNNNMARKGSSFEGTGSARPYEVRKLKSTATLGWSPTCTCQAPVVPCTVLDPFGGSGTTGLVADRLQCNAILIELSPQYAAMAERRIYNDAPLFADMREAAE